VGDTEFSKPDLLSIETQLAIGDIKNAVAAANRKQG
jgi:hypothetical protein